MTRENFGILAGLFKFTKKKDDTFLQRIVEVFKAPWFYGSVDRAEAEKQLEPSAKKQTDYIYFIVRFCNAKKFCFTFKKDNKWEHCNIEPADGFSEGGYDKYVLKYRPKTMKHEPISSLQKTFAPYTAVNKK